MTVLQYKRRVLKSNMSIDHRSSPELVSVQYHYSREAHFLSFSFSMSFLIFSGTGTPLWAALFLAFTEDFGLVAVSVLGLPVVLGVLSEVLNRVSGCLVVVLSSVLTLGFRGGVLVVLRGCLSTGGGGERRRRTRGGVCASEVCRDSSAALLNSCPQSQRWPTGSVVPGKFNKLVSNEFMFIGEDFGIRDAMTMVSCSIK